MLLLDGRDEPYLKSLLALLTSDPDLLGLSMDDFLSASDRRLESAMARQLLECDGRLRLEEARGKLAAET